MKIVIFASIGAQNLWDELILKNEINILKKKYKSKNPRFIVFSYDTKNIFFSSKNVKYKEYFPIELNNPKNLFKNIKNFLVFLYETITSSLIVIWWWWLFFDNEVWNKKNPLDLWLFRIRFFNFFLKNIYFFRVWLSIKTQDSFEKVYKIFSGRKKIIEVRDNYSLKVLQDLWIDNVIKKYDPVFFDNWEKIKNILNKKVSIKKIFQDFGLKDLKWINFKNKRVWIAFRRWFFSTNEQLEILMIKEIIIFIQNNWWEVILLPHSFSKFDILSNDYKWMKKIKEKVDVKTKFLNNFKRKKIKILNNMKDVYKIYKKRKVDIILAQRLHSIILSQVYEIPFIWISYSKKTNELLNELK